MNEKIPHFIFVQQNGGSNKMAAVIFFPPKMGLKSYKLIRIQFWILNPMKKEILYVLHSFQNTIQTESDKFHNFIFKKYSMRH